MLAKNIIDEIAEFATRAANGNEHIGRLIAEAFDKVGLEGVITVEEPKTMQSTVDVVEGMQFDRGYLSPEFVTDKNRMECVFSKPYILLYMDEIKFPWQLEPLLERVKQSLRPLLIIATNVADRVLEALVGKKQELDVCAVRSPGFLDYHRAGWLQDIADLTSGIVVSPEIGITLENVTLDNLGTARRVVITKDNTTIVDGAGTGSEIAARVAQLRRAIEEATDDDERKVLEERLAKLKGGVAVIRVGATTEAEMIAKKELTEHALAATRAAIEEGIIPSRG